MSGNFHSRWGGQDYCYLPFIFRTIRNMIQFKESFKITGGGEDQGTEWKFPFILYFFYFDILMASLNHNLRGGPRTP